MKDIWTFFAFPLNLLVALLWAIGLAWIRRSHPQCRLVRFLLSPAATVSSLLLLLLGCLWVGFSGDREFVQSVVFVAVLFYVQTVLLMVTLRGWRKPDGVVRWRFLLIHAGLLLALGSGFWGSPDSSELRMRLSRGETSHEAYRMDGSRTRLPYGLTLLDLQTEWSASGQPSYYEVGIALNDEEPVTVSVNHPYSVRFGEDVYLASISDDSCILQIVREPWRYFALAGILMLLAGTFMLFVKGPRR